jgi:hypothetical protein
MNDMHNENEIVFQGKNSPVDYTIAGLFGAFGGPLGIPVSIATIWLLAKHAGAQQKWLVWALIGLVAAPLSWMPVFVALTPLADTEVKELVDTQ